MTTLAELIPVLLQKTEAFKLDWENLASSSYVARLGQNAIELTLAQGHPAIYLRNSAGDIIERETWGKLDHPLDDRLEALYVAARRRALKADQTLLDVKKTLDDL